MDNANSPSYIISKVIDILLIKYPSRTALGIVMGAVLKTLVVIFNPLLLNLEIIDLKSVNLLGWLSIGLIITHYRTLISIFEQDQVGNEKLDEIIQMIEGADFTPQERRQQYRLLIKKTVNSLELSKNTKSTIDTIEQSLRPESTNQD